MTQRLEDQDMDAIDRAKPAPELRILDWPRRVRATFGGRTIGDSTRAVLLLEPRRLPVYYFPREDVRTDALVASHRREDSPAKGQASFWHVRAGERRADDAGWSYSNPPGPAAGLADHVAFYWDAMDAWFEEDDEVFVHPKDPYHRVDVLNSSRHVRVEIDGVSVAESNRPRLLFETGLPTRYYLPKVDVRMDLLERSDSVTRCPYKGITEHLSARVGDRLIEDVAWVYATPLPESSKIENLVCFYNERVDLQVDGELQVRPTTPWSR
jgi:uncharacterized protein (DUF427 family)